mgnify:CR=1 FL=1
MTAEVYAKTLIALQGSVAYVTQQAWMQNSTLRENILFGQEYHTTKYARILGSCCLFPDLKVLPASDLTEIGEQVKTHVVK